jgi:hypothetical protein
VKYAVNFAYAISSSSEILVLDEIANMDDGTA